MRITSGTLRPTFKSFTPCILPDANLYALTYIGGAAYDTTGDDTVKNDDSVKVKTVAGARATAPFVVDQHLVFSTGTKVEMFGDPNDSQAAMREFKSVVAIGPVDLAGAHTDLAESYFVSGKRAEAKKETLLALEIAPSYARAQDLLLQLTDAGARK